MKHWSRKLVRSLRPNSDLPSKPWDLRVMRKAAELESSTEKSPVTPGEVLPARELLGDMLMEQGTLAAALAEYEAVLERSPGRFNSLYGAGRAAALSGKTAKARAYYRQLVEGCRQSATTRPRLGQARTFLERN